MQILWILFQDLTKISFQASVQFQFKFREDLKQRLLDFNNAKNCIIAILQFLKLTEPLGGFL